MKPLSVVVSLVLVLTAALFLLDTNARRHFGVNVGLAVDLAIPARMAVVPGFVLLTVLRRDAGS